ncbi:MAG: hypothetical protein E6Q59_01135 [Nitrosomonas sp.]|nr:MAG: hypothetical protein E6Q59_01135 [Nitrosomonas sp.]
MTTNNIFFVVSRIADYLHLIVALPTNSKVFLLNPDQDDAEQVQAILSNSYLDTFLVSDLEVLTESS